MQKYILFILFLCLHWAARGQSGYDYRYWFDYDDTKQYTGSSDTESWHFDADLTGLDHSLHTLHLQVKDAKGAWSAPHTRFFLKQLAPQAGEAVHYRYWFDLDTGHQQTGTSSQNIWHLDTDLNGLGNTLHALHLQVMDGHGQWSAPQTRYFLKMPVEAEMRYYVWVDGQEEERTLVQKASGEKTALVDVSGLTDGFHILFLQAEGTGGQSAPHTSMFIKIPQTEGVDFLTCVCSVDGKLYRQEKVASSGGVVEWTLDVSDLSQGLHRLQVQVLTPSGAASAVRDGFFFRSPQAEELSNLSCLYNIDNGPFRLAKGASTTGDYHFNLDVADLPDGLHRITYLLTGKTGSTTKANMAFFYKTPLGGQGITEYRYWLNQDEETATDVKLSERVSPFALIDLLPVDGMPIRSECFHFECNAEGTPTMYAKNDIHFQFFDPSGRKAETGRQYVDYNVAQTVSEITPLESGVRVYKTKPGDNEVIWYTVDAERGDSLAFRLDQAASLQVFDAKGREMYAAEGAAAVKFGGCHVSESGTYYVALHDVKGTTGPHIAIDYSHIDRYAVLECAPKELGVMPCVHLITLDGNGYDRLQSAYLEQNGVQIPIDSIYTNGKTDTELMLTLKGDEAYGNYDLVLQFEEEGEAESLKVKNAVALAAPKLASIQIEVEAPRILASPYPVHIKLTNPSNLTYMHVPFNFAYDNVDNIAGMGFGNFTLETSEDIAAEGVEFDFVSDNFKEKMMKARTVPTLIPVIRAGETQVYTVTFKSGGHQRFKLYCWTGMPWIFYVGETQQFLGENGFNFEWNNRGDGEISTGSGGGSSSGGSGSGSSGDGSSSGGSGGGSSSGDGSSSGGSGGGVIIDGGSGGGSGSGGSFEPPIDVCMPDPCAYVGIAGDWFSECGCATMMGLANTFAGIYGALINRHHLAMRAQMGDFYEPGMFPTLRLLSPAEIARLWMNHCLFHLPGRLGEFIGRYNNFQSAMNGDPCPNPDGHPVEVLTPGDPNDLIGYTAESGSTHIKQGVERVPYTIRFENDPAIATAAAHHIVVTNRLDAEKFDLSSFRPVRVKIGDVVTELDGSKNFVKTIDLRPRLNVVAQLTLEYSATTGLATWQLEALDPLTMEPTVYAMDGVLPVNSNGEGEGELAYEIDLKPELAHATQIDNQATIVFDNEDAIDTPVWTNTLDLLPPEGRLKAVMPTGEGTANFEFEGTDEGSGVWKFQLYAQEAADAEWKLFAEVADTTAAVLAYESDKEYGFYAVAVDRAGNVQQKEPQREVNFADYLPGDANADGEVDAEDIVLLINYCLGNAVTLHFTASDLNHDSVIDAEDIVALTNICLSKVSAARVAQRRQRLSEIQK